MCVIETERLVFREFTQNDKDKLHMLLSDPIVMEYCNGPMAAEGTEKWLNLIISSYKEYGYDYWAVYEKSTNEFIGQIGILKQEVDGKQLGCLAYMLKYSHWNKGYATEGAMACKAYAFEVLKFENLFATIEPENYKSISVLNKIGMKYSYKSSILGNTLHIYSVKNS
jgi:[ribosomal protein S5]-alanine N-acetyltransferase